MIPLRDVIPSRTRPIVTLALMGVTALVFLQQEVLGGPEADRRLVEWVTSADAWWQAALPAVFLHGSWAHVVGNLLYLWIFGGAVEDRVGHGRFLGFYVLCGALAVLAAGLPASSTATAIGASGAISGVLAAYVVLFPHSRVLMLVPVPFYLQIVEVPAGVLLGLWLPLQLFLGLSPLHSGLDVTSVAVGLASGIVAGVLLIRVLRRAERLRVDWWDPVA